MNDAQHTDLQQFLFEYVEGLEDLHVLSCFRGLERCAWVTATDVAAATSLPDLVVLEAVERLLGKGLLERGEGNPTALHYAPPDPEFSAMLDRVLERYLANSLSILRIMSANSIERVRSAALRTFAEAFRIRGTRKKA